jgi:uncharacterized membrane protein
LSHCADGPAKDRTSVNPFSNYSVTFLSPIWLLCLLAIPFIVWQSVGSLSGLGPMRRGFAVGLRCFVVALLVAALADMQWVRRSDSFCTMFLLDYSQSIPNEAESDGKGGVSASKFETALRSISNAIVNRKNLEDQAGLIVFGKEARIELPPTRYPGQNQGFAIRSIGAQVDRQHTNIAAAIKTALGAFPPDCAKRIVLFSDGNQNLGNAIAQAASAVRNADGKTPIDVVPIEYRYDSEILVDKIVVPPDLKKGDTANLKIVLRSARKAAGLLKLYRSSALGRSAVAEQRVQLEEGLTVLTIKQKIEDEFIYEAEFTPDPDAGDRLARNNRRTGITSARGTGRVLLVEPKSGDFADLEKALVSEKLTVDAVTPEQLRESLVFFQPYDAVIVANVPAERITEPMQEIITAACRDLGVGLMMIGGEDSFGAGGYKNSPIEKALPVDMEIKSTKVRGKGALVMLMHGCEIPEGNFWEKETARLAVEKLGPEDECGILGLSPTQGRMEWVAKRQRVGNGAALKRIIGRMTPSDMPDFDVAMQMAVTSLANCDATNKHMIILSDGDPMPPTARTLQAFRDAKITCSTVAIAAHGGTERVKMQQISTATKGRFYEVLNPKALPQIFIHETRIVSRPLLFEKMPPWMPRIVTQTEPIAGLRGDMPGISGLVLTTAKPSADVPIISPLPPELPNTPVVAHWQYQLGRSVAVTTDAGRKWTAGWQKTAMYPKFWGQLVRWMLRPGDNKNLTMSMQEKDGEVTVVVNAVDKASEFMNFLKMNGTLVQPSEDGGKVKSIPVEFRQTEPGKYEAKFRADQSGSYYLSVNTDEGGGKRSMLYSGLDVSYPPEFRDLESSRELLESIASITDGRIVTMDQAGDTDFFLREQAPAFHLKDAWPLLLLLALCFFLFDVAVRRIAIEPAEISAFVAKQWAKMRRKPVVESTPTMERLKSIKQDVGEQLRTRRFEIDPTAEAVSTAPIIEVPSSAPRPAAPTPAAPSISTAPEPTEETAFSRLLKAKQDALKKRQEERES